MPRFVASRDGLDEMLPVILDSEKAPNAVHKGSATEKMLGQRK